MSHVITYCDKEFSVCGFFELERRWIDVGRVGYHPIITVYAPNNYLTTHGPYREVIDALQRDFRFIDFWYVRRYCSQSHFCWWWSKQISKLIIKQRKYPSQAR